MTNKDLLTIFKSNNKNEIETFKTEFWLDHPIDNFSIFISNKMEERKLTRLKIAKLLGYEGDTARKVAETLKKIINKPFYTTNRDRIIMISIILNLSLPDTNYALKLYDMRPLDEMNLRENIIITGIKKAKNIKTINNWLMKANIQPLNFETNKKSNLTGKTKSEFTIVKNANISIENNSYYNNSIISKYLPSNYVVSANVILKDNIDNYYELNADCDSNYSIKYLDDINDINKAYDYHFKRNVDYYKNIGECNNEELQNYFLQLQTEALKKKDEILAMLNDTRNYHIRLDVSFKNNCFITYAETFNYKSPEYNEYYQMTKIGNQYIMTISNKSNFLHNCLSDYNEYYDDADTIKIKEKYSCEEEIKEKNNKYSYIVKKEIYNNLKSNIDNLINDIKNHNKVIFDLSSIDVEPIDIAKWFNLEDKFEWIFDDKNGIYVPKNDSIILEHQKLAISISIFDLINAIEVDIFDLDFLCKVKYENKNLEDYL